jgi:hypothetical protein
MYMQDLLFILFNAPDNSFEANKIITIKKKIKYHSPKKNIKEKKNIITHHVFIMADIFGQFFAGFILVIRKKEKLANNNTAHNTAMAFNINMPGICKKFILLP